MQDSAITREWIDRLTDRDLDLLTRLAPRADVDPALIRVDPEALTRLLTHDGVHDTALGKSTDDPFLLASPFLVFALIVHRGWAELHTRQKVDEWVGARQRLPVLSGGQLREFLDHPPHRLFLCGLLASYTRVVSTTTWTRTPRGWRRHRFSELDPVRLASLLDVASQDDRAFIYQRLGDLALFRTGVFPDHTELHGLSILDEGRLLRLSGVRLEEIPSRGFPTGTVSLFEHLGQRWYGLAVQAAKQPLTGAMTVVAEVAGQFELARRVLNFLTDRYVFGPRAHWFSRLPA